MKLNKKQITKEKALALLAKRKASIINPKSIFDPNFPKQSEFILDPARLKTLFCTRRAAKSYTAGLYMVYEAITTPGCNCLFVGLTRASAKEIAWKDILKVINRKHKLGARFNEQALTMTFPNGSVIRMTGVDASEDEMNKLLGKKYRLVCVDEASMYTVDLTKLVYGILGPAMADQDGTICLMGTSSNFTRGLFFRITRNEESGWKLFQWTAHDNPHMAKQWALQLAKIDRDRPLFKDTPLYRQWYLNEWVIDEEKLVYKFKEEKNLIQALPKGLSPNGWTYILGVDTGWEDDNAFVLSAFHENDPTLYVVKTFNKPKMTFDQVVIKIQEFMNDRDRAPSKVIIDGANKQGVESMRARSSIPFEYADKAGKVDFIEILNADLVQAKVKVLSDNTNLVNELMGLVWMTDGDKIRYPKKEHPNLPNHLCDAFLYAWRNGYHYQAQSIIPTIAKGSKEWYQKQADDIWEREREHLQAQEEATNGSWPTEGGFGSYS